MAIVLLDATAEQTKGNHVYCAIECKGCKREGMTTLLFLKYLGLSDGRTMVDVPLAPFTLSFRMFCERCGEMPRYSRIEIAVLATKQAPPPSFVQQF
jgi:hypothetical protein